MATSPLVNLIRQRVALYNQAHPNKPIDLNAELAVVSQESPTGRPGDHNTSFGGNQLHASGALPAAVWAKGAAYADQWANSAPGVDYALEGVGQVSGGEHGAQAVKDIVARFERPADPSKEIAGALHSYGLPVGGGGPAAAASPLAALAGASTGAKGGQSFTPGQIASLLGAQQAVGLTTSPTLMQLLQAKTAAAAAAAPATRAPSASLAIPEMPAGAARSLASVPGPLDTHPGISVDQRILPDVEKIASQFDVKVNSGYRSPSHNAAVGGAQHSDHLTGDAVDFTGAPDALAALYKYAQGRFAYVEPMAQAKDHVHISFRR